MIYEEQFLLAVLRRPWKRLPFQPDLLSPAGGTFWVFPDFCHTWSQDAHFVTTSASIFLGVLGGEKDVVTGKLPSQFFCLVCTWVWDFGRLCSRNWCMRIDCVFITLLK